MAVIKSSGIVDQEARTRGILGLKGLERVQIDLITTPAIVADNEVIATNILIPVDSIIESVVLAFDDLGSTGDLNLGLHNAETPIDDLTDSNAIDEDCLSVGIDVNAAVTAPTEYRFDAQGIETIKEKAWETAGLSDKPTYKFFRLTLTASQATTQIGDISVNCKIVQ